MSQQANIANYLAEKKNENNLKPEIFISALASYT